MVLDLFVFLICNFFLLIITDDDEDDLILTDEYVAQTIAENESMIAFIEKVTTKLENGDLTYEEAEYLYPTGIVIDIVPLSNRYCNWYFFILSSKGFS